MQCVKKNQHFSQIKKRVKHLNMHWDTQNIKHTHAHTKQKPWSIRNTQRQGYSWSENEE